MALEQFPEIGISEEGLDEVLDNEARRQQKTSFDSSTKLSSAGNLHSRIVETLDLVLPRTDGSWKKIVEARAAKLPAARAMDGE